MNSPSLLQLLSFGASGWGLALLYGAGMTLAVALAGFAIGAVIGVCGAWAKLAGGPLLRTVAEGYTTVLRGIPDLLVIYLVYFGGSAAISALNRIFGGEGFIGFPAFLAGSLAVGVTSGAFQTEVFRGAFRAVARGELEAATACGMSRALRFRRIVLPLTLRYAVQGLGNVWQVILKESALVSVTGVVELLRRTQYAADATGRTFDFYLTATALYLLISSGSGGLLQWTERRLWRGMRR